MSEPILDVGHGSGIVLHVAKNMGFDNLCGIEYSPIAYDISKTNLDNSVRLLHGNALDIDLTPYSAITFFSPFRGEVAKSFFMYIPASVKTIITVNHDLIIEPILIDLGFNITYSYKHLLYKNFNAKIWKR
jgi:ribosomal protein L11 methylase PrmA